MEQMIPLFGMLTGIITSGLFFWGVIGVARSPIGQAFARRIQGKYGTGSDPELLEVVSAMRDQLDAMQQQLIETQERVEFTERLLSRERQTKQLSEG